MERTTLVVGTSTVAAVWIDPHVARIDLHPGTAQPGGAWPVPAVIPPAEYPWLLAAFNGGFKMADAHGGFFLDGVGAASLRPGAATFAIDAVGGPTVGTWGSDVTMSPTLVAARQNLTLLVDHGVVSPTASDRTPDAWGATLGGVARVWRSGVGVTSDGAIVYVAGPGLTSHGLASALVQAGAQRAMELDINGEWVTCNVYSPGPGTQSGSKLLPTMTEPGNRYLTSDSRDFFVVLARDDATAPLPPPGPTGGT
jgi:hypothetical protein